MSGATPEVIEVRADERFDEQKLASYLKGRLEGSDGRLEVKQFGGGHANLTYLLRFGEGSEAVEYVLRRPPLGPVAKSSHDMHREYRALSKLWRCFEQAPRAYLYCEDPGIIGADFLVMERRNGIVVRNAVPERFGGGRDPIANCQLSQLVIDTLAEFHAVDPAAVGLEGLGKPAGFLARQVAGWNSRYQRAKTGDDPIAEEMSRWLEKNLPESSSSSLVHNDWKLDNMAVAEDDPGRCVAVYDWDMCTLGDPLCDLGTLLGLWSNRGESFAPRSIEVLTDEFGSFEIIYHGTHLGVGCNVETRLMGQEVAVVVKVNQTTVSKCEHSNGALEGLVASPDH